MANDFQLFNFYRFVAISESRLAEVKAGFEQFCAAHGIEGLIVLATEGINSTVAGSAEGIALFETYLRNHPEFAGLEGKYSSAEKRPFRRLTVDIRKEIVTFGYATSAEKIAETSLTPTQWHQALNDAISRGEPPLIIDVRNTYEIALGKFKGATDPETDAFTDFPAFLERQQIPKDREVFMYCTGGIRCEKLTGFMAERGYSRMRQLSGGILKYLEEYPEGHYEGECFVFDHRVAVDQHLQPTTKYSLCVHCGDPGAEQISCLRCKTEAIVCAECLKHADRKSCSKNCAYHLRGGPKAVRAATDGR